MAELRYEFTPIQYKNKYFEEFAEFSYYWSFMPYEVGDGEVGLVLNIDMVNFIGNRPMKFESFLDYQGLRVVIEDLLKTYEGLIMGDGKSFLFGFSKKKRMLSFIKTASEKLVEAGIKPLGKIDRCSAFPSAEYATDMFTYLFDEDCSLIDVENCMLDSAGLYGTYDEFANFMELPITSKQRFKICESTDTSYYLDKYDEYLKDFIDKKSESRIPHCMKNKIDKYNSSGRLSTPIADDVSKEYKNFSSMWF